MALLNRARISSYLYSFESMYVSRTVSQIFRVKERRDLKTGDRGRSRSLKMAPFDRSYTTSIGRSL